MKQLALLLTFLLFALSAYATDRYVSPTGSGTACTAGSPCSVAQAVSVIVAGDHIKMQDGTYTGADYMLSATAKNGTAGSRIYCEAVNDGGVLIDGELARSTVALSNCDYWTVSGINVKRSLYDNVYLTGGSDYNEFKRVIVWDATPQNITGFAIDDGTNNLFEDCAAFGSARKQFMGISNGVYTTFRRCWGQFEYTEHEFEPKLTSSLYYNNHHTVLENCILTWDQQPGSNLVGPYGMFAGDWIAAAGEANRKVNCKVLASIAYLPTGKTFAAPQFMDYRKVGAIEVKDFVAVVPSDQPTKKPVNLLRCYQANDYVDPCVDPQLALTNASLIGGAASTIEDHWVQTNVVTGATVAAVYGAESLYVNSGNKGATIRYRTIDGVLTGTSLWPWPMNQRIIDAMTAAGKTPVNVDTTIQGIFGNYPTGASASMFLVMP